VTLRPAELSRDLALVDAYLSRHAAAVFAEEFAQEEEPVARTRARRFGAVLVASIAVAALLLTAWPGSNPIGPASLRGASSPLEGHARWVDETHIELHWDEIENATHYVLQMWDAEGELIVNREVDSAEPRAQVIVDGVYPLPLSWSVTGWANLRRIVRSDPLRVDPS